jgi:hypothetical protein
MTRSPFLATLIAIAGLAGSLAAHAQTPLPAGAPAGTTVQCKDGSFASPDKKAGACKGHKGIQTWYGAEAPAKPVAAASAPAAPAAAKPAATAATAAAPAPAASPAKAKTLPGDPAKMAAAPGGGAGKVWANDSTKVYHCEGDRYYGKTKSGEYMSEADAKAKGMHPDHGKACS